MPMIRPSKALLEAFSTVSTVRTSSPRSVRDIHTRNVSRFFVRSVILQNPSRSSSQNLRSVSMSTEISRSRLKINGLDRTTMYQLDRWSSQDPISLSIDDMLNMSEEKWFYTIQEELTVRLANSIMELLSVPQGLGQEIEFRKIIQLQVQSFNEIVTTKDIKFSDITSIKLAKTLSYIDRRSDVLVKEVSDVCQTFRKKLKSRETSAFMTEEVIQHLLDRFFTNMISTDLLIDVYIAVHNQNHQALENLVSRRCDIMNIIRESHDRAARACEISHQVNVKDLELIGKSERALVTEINISCLPRHLKFILFEVFKNALEANVDSSRRLGREGIKPLEVPAIKVLVSQSDEDVSVRVSDLGLGIPRDKVDSVMQYGVTSRTPGPNCMSGRGYGLPMSRVYARYLQGDLSLYSMHGLGTDVFLYLRTLGARECLPKYNVSSREKLNKPNKTKEDWI